MRKPFPGCLWICLNIISFLFACASTVNATDNNQATRYEVTPYLWAASIKGTTAIGGDTSPPIDSGYSFFSLDNLDGVASTTFSARGQQWGFLFDFLHVAYEDTFLENSLLRVTPRLEGHIYEFAGTYKPASFTSLELVAGVRQQVIDVSLSFLSRVAEVSTGWIDPFLGAIYAHSLTDRLKVTLRGDLGGFGIESDSAINSEAMLRYQFGETFSAKFGYRYLKVKFRDNNLVYDLSLDGFMFGLGIYF